MVHFWQIHWEIFQPKVRTNFAIAASQGMLRIDAENFLG